MRAGFIGLGNLGRAMAQRLRDEGTELVVWNRTREKADAFGAEVAASPAALVGQVDVVILCLASSDAVEAVLRGQDGLLSGDCAGKVIVDTTTNHHAPVPLFHQLAQQKGARYVDAPVAGSVVPASQGKLVAMVSGRDEDVAAARPFLEKIAASIHVLPGPGQATRMKLINNLCLGTFMAVIAEALATADAAGIDREQALDVLADGGAKSGVIGAKRQKLLDRDYAPHFSCAMIHKDLHCLQDLARDLGRPEHIAGVVKEQFGRTFLKGRQDEDFAAIYGIFEEG